MMFAWSVTPYVLWECLFNLCDFCHFCVCVPVLIRQEIQRLQDEREGFLHNLRVCHSADFSDVQYPTAMLTCVGRVVEELEAEKDKVASLNDQVKQFFSGTLHIVQPSGFPPDLILLKLAPLVDFVF